jgi:acyl-CoA synthetase (AMP-forming)/AMP-acid ligase II
MNFVDYLFSESKSLDKNFILGNSELASFSKIYKDTLSLALWIKSNIGEEKPILLISQNSVFFIVAYLAIMKSGNTCIPLNPEIEQSNLNVVSKMAKSSHAFVASTTMSKYAFDRTHVFDESILDQLPRYSKIDRPQDVMEFNEDRLAQILFTSGSTGVPKGVMLSHKNLRANTESIKEYLELDTKDIMLVVLPFYYCYGLSLLHTHLKVGGSIVMNNTFIFLGSVLRDLKKYNCTGFAGVPSHFQVLLRKSDTFKRLELPDLKYVTQAGGKLHNVFIKEFLEAFPDKRFYVMYGQTEATARLSYMPPHMLNKKLGSIGIAIPGVQLDIFNEQNEPVEKGEVGEIVARGDNIMMGYLADIDDTNQALINGWLHTGDMAKMDEDGYIYIYSRKKEIIKAGGKRISPKEIEEVIVTLPFVLSCKVKGVYDEVLGETIKSTIILKNGMMEDKAKELILLECKQKLTAFKIPRIIDFEKKMIDPLRNK